MKQNDPWSLDAANQPARDEPTTEAQTPTTLEEALLALDHKAAPVFAVLDGAQFDNLPQELMLGDFVSRPLYLDRGDNNPEQIITAPHMVWLDERAEKITGRAPQETIPALMTLIANRPAAVFWQCPAGAEALYKHLRGINMVLIPKEFAPPDDLARPDVNGSQDSETHEAVLFRHADANVIAQTLPAMDAAEIARFYGPAARLFFASDPDWAHGRDWLQADRFDALPKPQSGLLTLSAATMEEIKHARERRSLQRTVGFLRRTLPPDFQGLSDQQLEQIARSSRKSGKELGVSSAGGHQRWAYLMAITEGRVAKDRRVRDFIRSGDETPDRQVKKAMLDTLERMKQAAAEIDT
ncbi:DUF4123 domain-containing protein [Paracoccus fistulariae]|uniref:DUF4123 domain-containing protein n=1 Tax=Paracoccus fistulariae TaxID=658446 RepID=A0ABY7SK97_9RHOB|nr:DUF4123 domain-containing protein [Paracoccus fistulariae]MDB6183266.1 DUF4123 domain-containing protein [Paracoccus fistulariae]WCR07315.1 DUF4123 domain-containing protein [Paracoccus fistulariae]